MFAPQMQFVCFGKLRYLGHQIGREELWNVAVAGNLESDSADSRGTFRHMRCPSDDSCEEQKWYSHPEELLEHNTFGN